MKDKDLERLLNLADQFKSNFGKDSDLNFDIRTAAKDAQKIGFSAQNLITPPISPDALVKNILERTTTATYPKLNETEQKSPFDKASGVYKDMDGDGDFDKYDEQIIREQEQREIEYNNYLNQKGSSYTPTIDVGSFIAQVVSKAVNQNVSTLKNTLNNPDYQDKVVIAKGDSKEKIITDFEKGIQDKYEKYANYILSDDLATILTDSSFAENLDPEMRDFWAKLSKDQKAEFIEKAIARAQHCVDEDIEGSKNPEDIENNVNQGLKQNLEVCKAKGYETRKLTTSIVESIDIETQGTLIQVIRVEVQKEYLIKLGYEISPDGITTKKDTSNEASAEPQAQRVKRNQREVPIF